MAKLFGQYLEYEDTRNGRTVGWKGYYWRGCTYITERTDSH